MVVSIVRWLAQNSVTGQKNEKNERALDLSRFGKLRQSKLGKEQALSMYRIICASKPHLTMQKQPRQYYAPQVALALFLSPKH